MSTFVDAFASTVGTDATVSQAFGDLSSKAILSGSADAVQFLGKIRLGQAREEALRFQAREALLTGESQANTFRAQLAARVQQANEAAAANIARGGAGGVSGGILGGNLAALGQDQAALNSAIATIRAQARSQRSLLLQQARLQVPAAVIDATGDVIGKAQRLATVGAGGAG